MSSAIDFLRFPPLNYGRRHVWLWVFFMPPAFATDAPLEKLLASEWLITGIRSSRTIGRCGDRS